MVCWFVEDYEMWHAEGGEPKQQACLFTAGQFLNLRVAGKPRKTDGSNTRAYFRFRCVRHQTPHVIVWAPIQLKLIELMLGEVGHPEIGCTRDSPMLRLQPSR